MKTALISAPLTLSVFLGTRLLASAGTWCDSFSQNILGSDWRANTNDFSIVGGVLEGESASPLPGSPLNLLEVGNDWSNYVVRCWINVVTPNLRVCTKGALLLRHNSNEGYVFALHVATKTIEVYRVSDHEMLLSKNAPLELGKWYRVRAELQGDTMSFFVNDELIGIVTDNRSPSGAVGVAVQDAEEVLFDDFTVTGPNVLGNRLEIVRAGGKIKLTWPNIMTNYVLKATDTVSPGAKWVTVTNSATAEGEGLSVTLDISSGNSFFTLTPNGP